MVAVKGRVQSREEERRAVGKVTLDRSVHAINAIQIADGLRKIHELENINNCYFRAREPRKRLTNLFNPWERRSHREELASHHTATYLRALLLYIYTMLSWLDVTQKLVEGNANAFV